MKELNDYSNNPNVREIPGANNDTDRLALRTAATVAGLNTIPAGVVLPYGGASAPSGWLLCDGSAISRTTYATLFTAISTNYGTGDGSSTFNIPDLRGRVPVGKGTHADTNALNDNDGITESSRTPNHTHAQNSATLNDKALTTDAIGAASATNSQMNATTASPGDSTAGMKSGVTASPVPYVVLNYIIKI